MWKKNKDILRQKLREFIISRFTPIKQKEDVLLNAEENILGRRKSFPTKKNSRDNHGNTERNKD